jgi:glycosyltransferase involved in cell wall biosynthesis
MDSTNHRLPHAGPLLVTSTYSEPSLIQHLGREAYSYRFVYGLFAPLLDRWAPTLEVIDPERNLAGEAQRALQKRQLPVHVGFSPLHLMTPAPGIPNIVVPAWEFPDIPVVEYEGNPRNNWARVANEMTMVITHTAFSAQAFLRGGVTSPIRVVPVPVPPAYFAVPPHDPQRSVVIDSPCYILQPLERDGTGSPSTMNLRRTCKRMLRSYYMHLQPLLPVVVQRQILDAGRALTAGLRAFRRLNIPLPPVQQRIVLSGIVYTSIFNPFDGRKNWEDMLSGFLRALGPRDDATLVLKLVISRDRAFLAVQEVLAHYHSLKIPHRCRIVIVTEYLAAEQMLQLAESTTYYLNTSRAEGSCLPLQDYLAAGRPAVAPCHTGMADSVADDRGFPVASHPEPAVFPNHIQAGMTTTWHRLVWSSLVECLEESYAVARVEPRRYRAMSAAARNSMIELVSEQRVWPKLRDALNEAANQRYAPSTAVHLFRQSG